jgi:hypothetical protein
LDKNSQRTWLSENFSHWNGYQMIIALVVVSLLLPQRDNINISLASPLFIVVFFGCGLSNVSLSTIFKLDFGTTPKLFVFYFLLANSNTFRYLLINIPCQNLGQHDNVYFKLKLWTQNVFCFIFMQCIFDCFCLDQPADCVWGDTRYLRCYYCATSRNSGYS